MCSMYIETIEEKYINRRWGHVAIRHIDVYRCDDCSREHRTPHKVSHVTSGALTFCSKACSKRSRSSGAIAAKRTMTNLERHGVAFAAQVEGATDRMLATRVGRYGTVAPIHHNDEVSARWRRTMQERHGADHPLRAGGPKAKREMTVKERFGVDPLALPKNRTHLVEAGQKGYRTTAKRVGSWVLSRPETMLVEWLRSCYGHDNVDQQVKIDHGGRKPWLIDAYIRTIDMYVELDGEFWHGLDRPYDRLHPKGKEAFDRDRVQDEWFLSTGKKLVRITDKEFLACQESGDFTGIVSKLGG